MTNVEIDSSQLFAIEGAIRYMKNKGFESVQEFSEIRPHQYARMEEGRIIISDSVIEKGKRYKGRDINQKNLPEVEMEYSDIHHISDEICKAVIVE